MNEENNLIAINIVKRLGEDVSLNVDCTNKSSFTTGGAGNESN